MRKIIFINNKGLMHPQKNKSGIKPNPYFLYYLNYIIKADLVKSIHYLNLSFVKVTRDSEASFVLLCHLLG